jgi:predicted DNA-binding transcriptional regulator AlpA
MSADYLTAEQVGERLGVSKHTVYTWHRRPPRHPVPKAVQHGGRVLWLRAEVERYVAEQLAARAGHDHATP